MSCCPLEEVFHEQYLVQLQRCERILIWVGWWRMPIVTLIVITVGSSKAIGGRRV